MPASLLVGLKVDLGPMTQALPTTWDTATLTLSHPTTLSRPRTRTLLKGTDIVASGSTYVAAGSFGQLRPANGYNLTVDLWNGGVNGTLVGERQVTLNLRGGANQVTVATQVYPTLGLSGFSPTVGLTGDSIVLSGQGFSVLGSQDRVTLGGATASLTSASSVSLSVAVPDL